MAEALIAGLLEAGICRPESIWATDPVPGRRELLKRRFGVQVGDKNRDAVEWAQTVLLAVKPQVLEALLGEIGHLLAGRLVVSIVAGVTTTWIRDRVTRARGVVRAMPNMAVHVRAGMTALTLESHLAEADQAFAQTLFEAVGRVVTVEECLMDAVTGLSGSGPAYVFVAIEAMADGGVKMGLPRRTAELLAAQTVLGAARMVLERQEHPARLKDQVASPGGTTIAGLHELEKGGVRACLMAAVEAAAERSRELGR